MTTMKKLVLLLSVLAVSFALQAGAGICPKDKAACDKAKAAACDKAKAGACCAKAKAEAAKGCCPGAAAAKETAKQPVKSPKAGKAS